MKRRLQYLSRIPFVRDVATMQAGSAVAIGLNLLSSILYTRFLGPVGYGVYAVVLAFTGTFSIAVNWGQGSSATTFFAEQYGKKDVKGMAGVLSYFLIMTVGMAALLLILIAFSPAIAEALYHDASIGRIARISFLIILLSAAPTVFFAILQTVREIRTLAVLEQGSAFTALLLSALFLLGGGGVAGVLLAQALVNLLQIPLFLFLYGRLRQRYVLPGFRDIIHPSLTHFREYFVQGLWIGLDKNIGNLYPNVLFFVMSVAVSPAMVGLARISFTVSNVPRRVLLAPANQLATTVLPTVSARGNRVLRQTCVRLLKHALLFHALLSFGAAAVLPFAIHLFYGAAFDGAIVPAIWLTLIGILAALNVNNTPLLRLLRKTWLSTVWSATTILIACGAQWMLLSFLPPLTAFVAAAGLTFVLNQGITAYVYFRLLAAKGEELES